MGDGKPWGGHIVPRRWAYVSEGQGVPRTVPVGATTWYCASLLCQRLSVAFAMPFSIGYAKNTRRPLLQGCGKCANERGLGFCLAQEGRKLNRHGRGDTVPSGDIHMWASNLVLLP